MTLFEHVTTLKFQETRKNILKSLGLRRKIKMLISERNVMEIIVIRIARNYIGN